MQGSSMSSLLWWLLVKHCVPQGYHVSLGDSMVPVLGATWIEVEASIKCLLIISQMSDVLCEQMGDETQVLKKTHR